MLCLFLVSKDINHHVCIAVITKITHHVCDIQCHALGQPTAACRPNPLPAATSATTDHVQSSGVFSGLLIKSAIIDWCFMFHLTDFDPYQASMGGQPFAKESPSASRVRKEDRQGRHNRGAAVDRGDQITSTSDLTLPTQGLLLHFTFKSYFILKSLYM